MPGVEGVLPGRQQGLVPVLVDKLGGNAMQNRRKLARGYHRDVVAKVNAADGKDLVEDAIGLGGQVLGRPGLDDLMAVEQEGREEARLAVEAHRVGAGVGVAVHAPGRRAEPGAERGPSLPSEGVLLASSVWDTQVDVVVDFPSEVS